MRAYLINQQENFEYEEFLTFYTAALTVSWPYPTTDIIISCASESCCSEVKINPIFEHHVMRLDTWTLKDSFLERFPVFRNTLGD